MMLWAKRGVVLGVLGTCSATAADGPKLEPPARPTRSEVEGTAVPSAPMTEAPEGGNVSTSISPREGLAPIHRPAAPPIPVLRAPMVSIGAVEAQSALPPALEGPRAITLEAVPDLSEFDPKPPGGPVMPVQSREREEHPPIRIEPEPRRRGFFGLFRREPRVERYESAPRTSEGPSRSMPAPNSDPSADSALRRKVKAQADRALGRHLRDLDVRVVGQKIRIRARADFFWNKRGIRKGLADLPAIRGHETTIEVD